MEGDQSTEIAPGQLWICKADPSLVFRVKAAGEGDDSWVIQWGTSRLTVSREQLIANYTLAPV